MISEALYDVVPETYGFQGISYTARICFLGKLYLYQRSSGEIYAQIGPTV